MDAWLQGSLCLTCLAPITSVELAGLAGLLAGLGLPTLAWLRSRLARASPDAERRQALTAAAEVLFRELVAMELDRLHAGEGDGDVPRLVGLSETSRLARGFSPEGRRRMAEARFLMAEEVRLREEAAHKAQALLEALRLESQALAKAYALAEEPLPLGSAYGSGERP